MASLFLPVTKVRGSPPRLIFTTRAVLAEPLQSSCVSSHPRLIPSQIRSLHTTRRRKLHSTRRPEAAAATLFDQPLLNTNEHQSVPAAHETPAAPLSKLPTLTLLRSILLQQASSIPTLLNPSIALLSYFATAKSPIFSPDRNPILRRLLKLCVYDHFCAGENAPEVSTTTKGLKAWGVQGILLGWAREVEFRKQQGVDVAQQLQAQLADPAARSAAEQVIREWGAGTLKTVEIASPGDHVAMKFSGAGPLVLSSLLSPDQTHHPLFVQSLHEICRLSKARGISLCIDAEQQRFQPGIDALALSLSREYNGTGSGSAVISNTYQCYLKSIPSKLSDDLKLAAAEGWTLGAKLVRGAYLASEPRGVIWDTKEDTDNVYDGLAEGLIRRNWAAGGYLSGSGTFPNVDVVLATHNLESVVKTVAIRQEQAALGEERIQLVYAQLMGMADHVSAAAIQAGQRAQAIASARGGGLAVEIEIPRVHKYLVWGSVQECMRYLVRRAEENRDAATRTVESRRLLWEELKRRISTK